MSDDLRAAARAYLAHDGSGIGRHDEWAGDFDAMDLAVARDRLRAALATPEPDVAVEAGEAWADLRDAIAREAYDLTRSPNGPSELRGELSTIIARHRPRIEAALRHAPDLDVERLTTVLYDWMPDGADVAVGFDGEAAHLTGRDLADYLFARAREYAALRDSP